MKDMRKNIFEMYHDNGDCAGFWVVRKSWGRTVARVVKVFGKESGSIPGVPPYHSYSESRARKNWNFGVVMDVFWGLRDYDRCLLSCPGTYSYRQLEENEVGKIIDYLKINKIIC